MHYILLIHQDERSGYRPRHWAELAAAMGRGARLLGDHRLHASHAATAVRNTPGGLVVSDGPFTEDGEPLSEICVVEMRDLDDALLVAKVLARRSSGVEIRPVRTAR